MNFNGDLLQDLKFGSRMLAKSSGFTVIAVLALGLGIGANSAIFSFVNTMLLRPLPYPDSDRLVFIQEKSKQFDRMSVAYANFIDWRDQNQSFESIGAFRGVGYNLTGGNEPEHIFGAQVSAPLFASLRAQPVAGRLFSTDEDKPGVSRAVILSYSLWQRRFGADPSIVGRSILLDSESYNVVGVMAKGFNFPSETQFWVPIGAFADKNMMDRGNHPGIRVVARLKPGVSLEQARADLASIAERLEGQFPLTNAGNGTLVFPLRDEVVRPIRQSLLLLFGSVAFLLLIACANVANLLLARGASRYKEIAVRTALGAGRLRLVRQLLTESLLLALIGGVVGLAVGYGGAKLLVVLSPEGTPRIGEFGLDGWVLAFNFGIALLTGLIFGFIPALQASKPDFNETLKEGGRGGSAGAARHRVRNILVISEMALAVVLLIGAGLMIRSFMRIGEVKPGLDPAGAFVFDMQLPQSKYSNGEQISAFFKQVLERIAIVPGVQSAGLITPLPLRNDWEVGITPEGQPAADPSEVISTDYAMVDPDYFHTMGVALLSGRSFGEQDRKDATAVLIVDDTFAKKFWPVEDPIGKRVKLGGPQSTSPWMTIVGVVGHVMNYGPGNESRIEMYVPHAQHPSEGMTLVVRGVRDSSAIVSSVREAASSIDTEVPAYNFATMDRLLSDSVSNRRSSMVLFGVFSVTALILAALGIYGVMSFSVTQRTHEIGIRMALGAGGRHVLGLMLKQGMVLSLIGAAVGVAGALGITRAMAGLLYGVSATDSVTFASIPVLLLGVSLMACYIPARKATRLDPTLALRDQ
jgi:putative ABC transport system permease protein